MLCDLLLQALTESAGQIKRSAVGQQADSVRRPLQDRGAMLAILQVQLDAGPELGVYIVIDIVRNLAPNFETTDFNNFVAHCS